MKDFKAVAPPARGRTQTAVSLSVGLLTVLLAAGPACGAQARGGGEQAATPGSWAEAAARNEVAVLQQQGTFSLQYRERRIDDKGDVTRIVIEAKEGGVARLIERNGKPITAAEDAAERARLQDAMSHPDAFIHHHRRDNTMRSDSIAMVKLLPAAMIYTFAPGQPQLPNISSPQVVLDFTPNRRFHPPTLLSEALTGFSGRVWIDQQTRYLTRIEGRVLRPVNFGFGLLARLYPGGTVALEQIDAGDGHRIYSHVEDHLVVRAMMVKTVTETTDMRSSDIELLPALIGYQDAIRRLLSLPVPLR